jgi:hypothetical protein
VRIVRRRDRERTQISSFLTGARKKSLEGILHVLGCDQREVDQWRRRLEGREHLSKRKTVEPQRSLRLRSRLSSPYENCFVSTLKVHATHFKGLTEFVCQFFPIVPIRSMRLVYSLTNK